MAGWTDSHCHVQDYFLDDDEPARDFKGILERAAAAGVTRALVVGTDAQTSAEAIAACEPEGPVERWATVGLHPHQANEDLAPVADLIRSGHPRVRAVGECGLDYFYEYSPRADQRRAFAAQIALAIECDLALVVHARGAFEDLFAIFASEGLPRRTLIHCFTGTPEDAESCLERGADVSISGIVTFKRAEDVRAAARLIPLERLHVETDSPYLAPVPYRGRTNEPAYVAVVGGFLAELRGEREEALRAATAANSARLFALGPERL